MTFVCFRQYGLSFMESANPIFIYLDTGKCAVQVYQYYFPFFGECEMSIYFWC